MDDAVIKRAINVIAMLGREVSYLTDKQRASVETSHRELNHELALRKKRRKGKPLKRRDTL